MWSLRIRDSETHQIFGLFSCNMHFWEDFLTRDQSLQLGVVFLLAMGPWVTLVNLVGPVRPVFVVFLFG